jgi:hypothetical protein
MDGMKMSFVKCAIQRKQATQSNVTGQIYASPSEVLETNLSSRTEVLFVPTVASIQHLTNIHYPPLMIANHDLETGSLKLEY